MYHCPGQQPIEGSFSAQYQSAEVDEHSVYERLALSLNLKTLLKPNVESIAHYAFTEMLNNAIDHSDSEKIRVKATLDPASLNFEVKDWGKGVFASIADKFALEDEHSGMVELIKGKTTTMPEAHSGEGIFFTSRAVDHFTLRSHKIQLEWDRPSDDVYVSSPRNSKGTSVKVQIIRNSRLRLEDLFSHYAPEEFDYEFNKTQIKIKLLRKDYISRSEAKRLLLNLDKFRFVELDFRDVLILGQGFADEVFRVFQANNQEIEITPINAGPAIEAMIRHVIRPK
jgi:anti-sigma regulatory factor (Ser/Thr protein kinase)